MLGQTVGLRTLACNVVIDIDWIERIRSLEKRPTSAYDDITLEVDPVTVRELEHGEQSRLGGAVIFVISAQESLTLAQWYTGALT